MTPGTPVKITSSQFDTSLLRPFSGFVLEASNVCKFLRGHSLQAKIDFLNFFGLNTLNFPYISEELTDKYHLRKSILDCILIPSSDSSKILLEVSNFR
jgi:hypothetical protein